MYNKKTLSLSNVMELFPTKKTAIRFLEKAIWGWNGKVVCNRCGLGSRIKKQKNDITYWCGNCRSYFGVLTSTPLAKSKLDHRQWIYAGYVFQNSNKKPSDLMVQFMEELSMEKITAVYAVERLEAGCNPKNNVLISVAEMDKTYEAYKASGKKPFKDYY